MTAPAGVVDLSLPDYATLVARAGVNPDAEAARVASAAPAAVRGAGTAFGRAGGELDSAFTASMGAQGSIGAAFTNGGAPVLDRGTHVANLPAGFGDAGTRLAGTSGRLTAVAEDLAATMRETSTAVTGLHGELQQTRSSWAARVAAAGTLQDGSGGGLIPQEAIPGLLAERDRIAAGMATRVGAVGREVVGRIGTYETVINDAVRLLADHGFVPPAERDAGPPPAPVVEYGGGADPSGYGTPLMAGYAADPVNTALGNFVEVETDLPFGGLLAGLTFARTYNSRSDRVRAFGPGWSSWASTRLVEGTWTAEFEGPDGQRVAFPRTGTGFGRAVGIDALVERARVRPGAGVVRRAALGVRRRGPGGAHLGRPGHRGPVRARRRRPAGRAGPRARAAAGPRLGRRPHRRRVTARTGGASPTATTGDCWSRRTDRPARAATGSTAPAGWRR